MVIAGRKEKMLKAISVFKWELSYFRSKDIRSGIDTPIVDYGSRLAADFIRRQKETFDNKEDAEERKAELLQEGDVNMIRLNRVREKRYINRRPQNAG